MLKRLFLSLLMACCAVITTWGARALSIPFTVTQPDGTTLVLALCGDEYASWLQTTDGLLVVQAEEAYYVAAIDGDGCLSVTSQLAHEADRRDAVEQQVCQQQQERRALFDRQTEQTVAAGRRAQVTDTSYFPHQGTPRCLVILVNFSDNAFSSDDPVAQFQQYFNGDSQQDLGHNEQKNFVGVSRYFELSSHGLFKPQFDIVGPVTLPETLDYYGSNISGANSDAHISRFGSDAIAAVDAQVDFHDYDNRGSGSVELVCIVYAGYGENVSGNPANTIWPQCNSLNVMTADGVRVRYVNCISELYRTSKGTDINGIGVFLHEFSHGMGLPDLYPTNTSARISNQTPEFWDLMDYGEYDGNGFTPVPYTAWEQEAMGWTTIEPLTASRQGIELTSLMQGGKAYKFGNGANDEEWMIIENVRGRDTEQFIPGFRYGHGMLVTHIAYRSSAVSMKDFPNNTPSKPRVSIVPADGLVINGYQFGKDKPYTQQEYTESLGGDPFPGTTGLTSLDASMQLPNYTFYNGEATPVFKLTNITEDTTTGVVTFDFDAGSESAISTLRADQPSDDPHYYTLSGQRLTARPATNGLYLHRGKKLLITAHD